MVKDARCLLGCTSSSVKKNALPPSQYLAPVISGNLIQFLAFTPSLDFHGTWEAATNHHFRFPTVSGTVSLQDTLEKFKCSIPTHLELRRGIYSGRCPYWTDSQEFHQTGSWLKSTTPNYPNSSNVGRHIKSKIQTSTCVLYVFSMYEAALQFVTHFIVTRYNRISDCNWLMVIQWMLWLRGLNLKKNSTLSLVQDHLSLSSLVPSRCVGLKPSISLAHKQAITGIVGLDRGVVLGSGRNCSIPTHAPSYI